MKTFEILETLVDSELHRVFLQIWNLETLGGKQIVWFSIGIRKEVVEYLE